MGTSTDPGIIAGMLFDLENPLRITTYNYHPLFIGLRNPDSEILSYRPFIYCLFEKKQRK